MQFHIPTPCTAKRSMDDYFCYRFSKRLRINGPECPPHPLAEPPPPLLAAASASPYGDVNGFLHRLHAEQLERRPRSVGTAAMATEDEPRPQPAAVAVLDNSQQRVHGAGLFGTGGDVPMTSFSLPDVVRCSHGAGGRCLQCAGRLVQNVPWPLYSAFCAAHPASSPSSSSSSSSPALAQRLRQSAAELSFPACASLVACLAPEAGERLLHLGSGVGRVLAVWALLVPLGAACGIEECPSLHQEAVAAAMRLPPAVQGRLFLHCGDAFAAQEQWHQATTIFVSAARLDDGSVARLADGLQEVKEGTRVVSLSRPLCPDPSRAPTGFEFARQAAYCAAGTGNCSVYIYRKCGQV
mmetsp:Transcript_119472/g.372217  ORF Transcript_119472/g.372217 Transcript_119472/m.372217 type:complete len:353 (-) Transcript_119472:284-1342(-)